MDRVPVARSIQQLAAQLGSEAFAEVCVDLLRGADRTDYVHELRQLTGHAWLTGDAVFDPERWPDYWVRTWGARGLLHEWNDLATEAIVGGMQDEHWRPVEMCLKVSARHEVAGSGDGAAALVTHPITRVRLQALRALATVGDTFQVVSVVDALTDPDVEVAKRAELTLVQLRHRLDMVD